MHRLFLIPVSSSFKDASKEAYQVGADYFQAAYIVPEGFQFDGASIPWFAWYIVGTPFNPKFMRASVFHDWIYHTHEIERAEADQIFYDMLKADGVNPFKAALMYFAVSWFGKNYWSNDDNDANYLIALAGVIKARGKKPSDYGLPL